MGQSASSMVLLDRQRRIVEVNDAHLALTAYRRETLIDRPFVEFVLGGQRMAQTARQLQIVELIALGATGPEIAAQLQLSHHTVKAHINNAKTTLGVRSRAQLVLAALPALNASAAVTDQPTI